MHCSLPLKIVITFQTQGGLNLLLFNYSWALKHFSSKQAQLKDRIDNLLEEFLFGSAAAGYALCIAAFTQLNDITNYHLYLCYTLLLALSTVQKNLEHMSFSRQQNPFDRTLDFYFLGNQLLLVSMNCLLIYRLTTVWDDTGGKCFLVWIDGNGSPDERDNAVLWLYINLIWGVVVQLVYVLVVRSGWSKLWAPQNLKAKLVLTILFSRIPGTFWYIWSLYWMIKLTIANQSLIDDNEYSFGFGQVGALVTLCLSICRAYILFKGARRILSWDGQIVIDMF